MKLREYQADLVNNVRDAWKNGKKAPCIVLPCGGGKSVIVAEIAKKTTHNGKNVLFLVHRKELCAQIERTFRDWGVNMQRCSVMMVQTASRRLKKIAVPTLIITDENHHSKANSYMRIYEHFPDAYRVGVTATPVRLDGSGLTDVNDILIEGVSAKWLIDNNFLSPYDYYAPSLMDLTGIKIKNGDFDAAQVDDLVIQKAIFGDVIAHYKKLADGKQAICYCTSIKVSQIMAEKFCGAGIEAVHIDGKTPRFLRDMIIEKFRCGAIDILCNVDLISEGFDVPDCECAILLRPTQSLTLYIQQSMRCMRYKPGKRAVIIDHVGNYARFGMPDADRKWDLNAKKKDKKAKAEEEIYILECPECFYVYPLKNEDGTRNLTCPNCGYIHPAEEKDHNRDLDQVEGKLQKITGFVLDYKTPAECRSYSELLDYAKKHNYKPGWAYYQAKERGLMI